jgi:hypothetical protein
MAIGPQGSEQKKREDTRTARKKSAHQEKRQGRAYRRHRSEAVGQILGHRRRRRRRPQDSEEWRRADRTQAHSTEEGNLSTPLLRRAQGLIAQARRSMTVEARKIPQVRRGCLEQGKTQIEMLLVMPRASPARYRDDNTDLIRCSFAECGLRKPR